MLQPAAIFDPPDTAVTARAPDQPRTLPSSAWSAPRLIDDARMPPPDRAMPYRASPRGGAFRCVWVPSGAWVTASEGFAFGSMPATFWAYVGSAQEASLTQSGVDHQAKAPAAM